MLQARSRRGARYYRVSIMAEQRRGKPAENVQESGTMELQGSAATVMMESVLETLRADNVSAWKTTINMLASMVRAGFQIPSEYSLDLATLAEKCKSDSRCSSDQNFVGNAQYLIDHVWGSVSNSVLTLQLKRSME